jgi:antitoxin (DNA-binding transcriptional repressor) of toxin-antitoxin stability system
MVRAEKIVDIDETTDLVSLTEDVQASGETTVLQRDGKPVAKLVPVEAKPRKRSRLPRGKPMSSDDPLWKLIGKGNSGGSNIAEFKHEYIAQAIEQHRET